MEDIALSSHEPLTLALRNRGVLTWNELLFYTRRLPYGRTTSRVDLLTVIDENRGTCSSKHALVAAVARENNIGGVLLVLCIYKMTSINTPGIGAEIEKYNLPFIPEAHCYLHVGGEKIDLTTQESDLCNISDAIMQECYIEPSQIGEFKIAYHRAFISNWIIENSIGMTLDAIWSIREDCIRNLGNQG